MNTQTGHPRPRLSVALIVRNEQDVLGETLDSVWPIADEILVLDTGSTDRTLSVAAQWGAGVLRAPWDQSFAAARNRLLSEVRGDWILWLDAGERLDAKSATDLRQFIDREADSQRLYLLLVEVPGADPAASSEQAARARLMPNNPRLRFEGRVGESVRASAQAVGLRVEQAPGRILCLARRNNPQRKTDKAVRDLKLIALERAERGELTPRLWITLGEAYGTLNQPIFAEQAFLQAVRTAPRGSTEMLEGYYGLLTTLAADPTQRERQIMACVEALEIYPLDAQLLCAMGGYLQAQGRLDLAERSFRTAVQYGQVDLETWHLVEIAEVAAACLGMTLQLQGKEDEARGVLEKALDRARGSLRIRRQLLDLNIRQGREDHAIRLAGQLYANADDGSAIADAVRGACKAAKQDWVPALALLQSAYLAGCRDPLCLRWLSVALLSNGQIEAAGPVVRQWHEMEPDNHEAQAYLKAAGDATKQAEAGQAAPASEPGRARRLRFDHAATSAEVIVTRAPIVSQQSTLDAGPHSR